jgi:hypothetical protein
MSNSNYVSPSVQNISRQAEHNGVVVLLNVIAISYDNCFSTGFL